LTIDRPSLVLERSEDRPPLWSLRRLDVPDGVRDRGGGREQVGRALDHGETGIDQIAIGVNRAELATPRASG